MRGTLRIDDKVMQIRNNYDKEVYNGDIGRIVRIDTENQEVRIAFDGRVVAYEYSELDELGFGLRRFSAQVPGVRIPVRNHSPAHPALYAVAEEPHLYSHNAREAAGRSRGEQGSHGYSGKERPDPETFHGIAP